MSAGGDCYSYVRSYYGVPAYAGHRVRAGGREGVLARRRCDDHYVEILFDGDRKKTGPFHPLDVTYLVECAQVPSGPRGDTAV